MHLKNFSMIESPNGWILAPAHDLLNVVIVNPVDTEELALTIEGKKKKLKRTHFESLGKNLGLTQKQINSTFSRMIKNKPLAVKWIANSFLNHEMQQAYLDLMDLKYQQLDLLLSKSS